MNKKLAYFSLSSVLCAIGSAQPTAAYAQEVLAQESLAASEGEIVVTAQRREQSLQDVPVAVSVVSGDELKERNIRSISDLTDQQPSIKIAPGLGADLLHIRGVGSGFNPGFEQSVATFVDGVYRNRSRSIRVALFDIERIEILKGPQTTFFGANAIAGALNITTRKPRNRFAANVEMLYAVPDGEYNLEAGVDIPLTQDLSLRAVGRISGMDGYIKINRFDTDGPHLRDKQVRASLHYSRGAVTIDARYDYARNRDKHVYAYEVEDCPPAVIPAGGGCAATLAAFGPTFFAREPNRRSDTGVVSYSKLDLHEAMLSASIDLGFASLVSTSAYWHQRADVLADQQSFPGLTPTGTAARMPFRGGETAEQASSELRLQSKAGGLVEYMLGAYVEHNNLVTDTETGLYFRDFASLPALSPFLPPRTRIVSRPTTRLKTRTVSAFTSLTINATDRLSITGSLRYSKVKKYDAFRFAVLGSGDFVADSGTPFVPFLPNVQTIAAATTGVNRTPFAKDRRTDDAFMPSAAIKYNIDDDVMVYGSYTRGFKAGGFSMFSPDIFDPEYVNAFEVGFKGRFLNRRLVTNLALFLSNTRDLQESQNTFTVTGANILSITNAAKARSKGVEFESSYRVNDILSVRADVAYIDSRYVNFPGRPCTPIETFLTPAGTTCRHDASGERRWFAPKWSGSVGADVRVPLSDDLELGSGVSLSFTSGYFMAANISDQVRQPGYAKVDARISLGRSDGRWNVALIGRNLTNKDTYIARAFMGGGANGTTAVILDRPRSVALSLRLGF